MNIPLIFILLVIATIIIVYFCYKLVNTDLKGFYNDKSINIVIIILLLTTVMTIISFIVSNYVKKKFISIEPPKGDVGIRGDRGIEGKESECGLGCNDDAGYKKVMMHISDVYNMWCVLTGKPKLPSGRYIENEYIKMKVKEIVSSQTFSDLLQQSGAHKLDINGNPLPGYDLCDINSNCGAYDYLFQKWTEWILIILKYENGYMFLNSKNMDDNDFNTLITKKDINKSDPITKDWLFEIIDKDNGNTISINQILHPEEHGDEYLKQFRKSDLYHFYIADGVPDVYNVIDRRNKRNLSLLDSKIISNLKSPFEEIGEYDCWYWGANPLSEPKLINKCSYGVTDEEKNKKYKLKVKLCNDYDIMWMSKEARQERINYTLQDKSKLINVPNSSKLQSSTNLVYVPNNQKGNKSVVVLRPKLFTDVSEKDLHFKTYYPVGDVIADETDHKTNDDQCYPRYLKNTYENKPVDYNKNGSVKLTLLVSGDVKNPIGYNKVYQNLRKNGFSANKYGFTFWRPIAPPGYVALGDIIDVSPAGKEPSVSLIKCIPEECVEKLSPYDALSVYNTKDTSTSYNGITDIMLPDIIDNGSQVIDTDRLTDHVEFFSYINKTLPDNEFNENDINNIDKLRPYLSNYNIFRGFTNEGTNNFYKIKDEFLYDDTNLKQEVKDTLIVKPKLSEKYSILKIYDE